jgi:hypothetical protein
MIDQIPFEDPVSEFFDVDEYYQMHLTQVPPAREDRVRRKKPKGVRGVKGKVNGHRVHALADTGAGCNIMVASLARRLGFDASADHAARRRPRLRMANGKTVATLGSFEVVWEFSTPSDKLTHWRLVFHVLQDFLYDVVLGNEFLMRSETMSRHQHRLSRMPRPPRLPLVLSSNNIGTVSQRALGFLNGLSVQALPDSGSEASLLSLDYIRRRGWLSEVDVTDVYTLQFPDGSVRRTYSTINADWAWSGSTNSYRLGLYPGLPVKFHVLEGCPYDAIVGQDMLEESDAFSAHPMAFIELDTLAEGELESSALNLVIWLRQKQKQSEPPQADAQRQDLHQNLELGPIPEAESGLTRLHAELDRRAAADRRIHRLPRGSPERDAAVAAEEGIRRRFDGRYGVLQPLRRAVALGVSPSPTTPTLNNAPGPSASGSSSVGTTTPSTNLRP